MNNMVITVSDSAGIKCQAGEFSLLVDPPTKRKGNLILQTQTEFPVDSFSSPEVIFGPGEYEIAGVRVHGLGLPNESSVKGMKTIYAVLIDGLSLAFLIGISSELPENMLDELGEVDILFFSPDAKTLKGKQAVSLIKQVEPSIVIPADDKAAKFLIEEMGQKVKAEEKLTIKKKDLIKDGATSKLVWLKTA